MLLQDPEVTAGLDQIPDLDRTEDDDHDPGGEARERALEGQTDGKAGRTKHRGE